MARVEEEETDKVVKKYVPDHLKFSYLIPAFCLTEERGGSLRCLWELDSAECLSIYNVLIETSNFCFLYSRPK